MAYKNNIKPAVQLPFLDDFDLSFINRVIIKRTIVPDNKRIAVKPAASISLPANANLQNTEFAAKAKSANIVRNIIFKE